MDARAMRRADFLMWELAGRVRKVSINAGPKKTTSDGDERKD
jgi:hypothetical protein